jgi:antitoxin (DNA-binding transcriptional repressor) of toxin-antitoxin stability system
VQVNREEILQNFLVYFQHVEEGETVVILEAGKPVAEIRPLSIPGSRLRPFGLCAGEFLVPDDFDAPLPDILFGSLRPDEAAFGYPILIPAVRCEH